MGRDERHRKRGFFALDASHLGTLALTVEIAGERICLATVNCDPETGFYETFIGLAMTANQLGRHDASEERAVGKAEDFLREELRRLL